MSGVQSAFAAVSPGASGFGNPQPNTINLPEFKPWQVGLIGGIFLFFIFKDRILDFIFDNVTGDR